MIFVDMSTVKYRVDMSTAMDIEMHNIFRPHLMKSYVDRKMNSKIESLGITASQGFFIVSIGKNEGTSMKGLTAERFVDKSLTTRAVKQLMETGFVDNISEHPHKYKLVLTEKGHYAEVLI
jgi:DNA-binding MarR family transcriptional regulator